MTIHLKEQKQSLALLRQISVEMDCICDDLDEPPDPECARCAAEKVLEDLDFSEQLADREPFGLPWPDPPFRCLMEEVADPSFTAERIAAWEEAWGEMAARGHATFNDLSESERAELRRKLPWYARSPQLAPRAAKPS